MVVLHGYLVSTLFAASCTSTLVLSLWRQSGLKTVVVMSPGLKTGGRGCQKFNKRRRVAQVLGYYPQNFYLI